MKRQTLFRLILYPLLAIPALLVLSIPFLIGGFVWMLSFKPDYDTQHPDYARYETLFNRIAEELAQTGESSTSVDFAPLNGGVWKTACLFGGLSKPVEELRTRGAIVSDVDVVRMDKARHGGFRLYPVEENEAMIAYIGDDNRAHLIHFRNGLGQFADGYRGCVSKPETVLTAGAP